MAWLARLLQPLSPTLWIYCCAWSSILDLLQIFGQIHYSWNQMTFVCWSRWFSGYDYGMWISSKILFRFNIPLVLWRMYVGLWASGCPTTAFLTIACTSSAVNIPQLRRFNKSAVSLCQTKSREDSGQKASAQSTNKGKKIFRIGEEISFTDLVVSKSLEHNRSVEFTEN